MSVKLLNNVKVSALNNCQVIRAFATQIGVNLKPQYDVEEENISVMTAAEWETAMPFEKIPRPTKLEYIRSFLPGGKFHKKSIIKIYQMCQAEYGDIMVLPGTFGRRDLVLSFNPEHFRKVFRTEGVWPIRRGLDTITYYRKETRSELYEKTGGLIAEQGEGWSKFRTIVNPVMMQPKTIKSYVPSVDEVVHEFIERIRKIRDPNNLEVPKNFEEELNNWTLESVGLVALDTRLGLINNDKKDLRAQIVISTLKDFFQLVYDLDMKPSLWKYVRTPKFVKLMKTLDTMTETISEYIDEAKTRLEKKEKNECENQQESVLEKILKVDKRIAQVMAMDMMMAGVDTTSSAFVGCLFLLAKNPDKQENLRKEIQKILPEKNTPLTVEKMKNMPYLRACIKESLRIMPVTLGNFRTTGQDVVLSGYQVPKGNDVFMGSFVLQMDEKYFPKPKQFIPERWLRSPLLQENSECPSARQTDPFIFLPFGFGPRMCIGKRFVELEIEIALARIIRNFKVEYNHPDIEFKANVINVPSGELKFKFIDINN